MNYKLIDSGEGQKFEDYGGFTIVRPDPQAIWLKNELSLWSKADALYVVDNKNKKWKLNKNIPKGWSVNIGNYIFNIGLSNFKHLGVFPEHLENWKWLEDRVFDFAKNNKKAKVLNLFGYTGGATLALAKANAEVVHIDASKPAILQAKENLKANSLDGMSVRWIIDDVRKFVKREIKRGVVYDGVVMDPPVFGRGAKGEVWKIEKDLILLLEDVKKILNVEDYFILLNGYASLYTPRAYAQLLGSIFNLSIDSIEYGQLGIEENNKRKFILPAGIFAKVYKKNKNV